MTRDESTLMCVCEFCVPVEAEILRWSLLGRHTCERCEKISHSARWIDKKFKDAPASENRPPEYYED